MFAGKSMRHFVLPLIAMLIAAALMATGCGDDDADSTSTSTTSDAKPLSESMEQPKLIESEQAIDVALDLFADSKTSANVRVKITPENFTFTPENANGDNVDGEGHAHVYVDGKKYARVYGEDFLIEGLKPGEREISVSLNANDHTAYGKDGEAITANAMWTVKESDEMAHSHGDKTVDGGDATVALEGSADTISGANIQMSFENFTLTPDKEGADHVAGEGHLHLYIDGDKVTRIYSEWFHISGVKPGEHEVMVVLSSNDHQEYAVGGEKVMAMMTIDFPEADTSDHSHDSHSHDHEEATAAGDEDHSDHDH